MQPYALSLLVEDDTGKLIYRIGCKMPHLSHQKTLIVPPATSSTADLVAVMAICWAPNGEKLAVCTVDRVVLLFDENGIKRDKFPTKAMEKGFKDYFVKQMAFSPSSDKLAVAQTDNSVFVYKIGLGWGEKKSICNKFQHNSPTLCLAWPSQSPHEIVYGLYEGSVRIGNIKTHKGRELYKGGLWVYAIAVNPGTYFFILPCVFPFYFYFLIIHVSSHIAIYSPTSNAHTHSR